MLRNARRIFVATTATVALVAFGASAQAQGAKCVTAGGEATMVTRDLAEFMAKAALKNSISGMGAKPSGDIKLKCSDSGVLQYCKAEQKACK